MINLNSNRVKIIAKFRSVLATFQHKIGKSFFYNNTKEEKAGQKLSGRIGLALTKSNNRGMEEPRQKHSGMTLFYNGFTLLELLVVVLIIGILAAVALPQYQKAVAKSRLVQLRTIATSLAKAGNVYYLANNTWPSQFDQLDVDLPPAQSIQNNCSIFSDFYCCIQPPIKRSHYGAVTCARQDFSFGWQALYAWDDGTPANLERCYETNNLGVCQSFDCSLLNGNSMMLSPQGILSAASFGC